MSKLILVFLKHVNIKQLFSLVGIIFLVFSLIKLLSDKLQTKD